MSMQRRRFLTLAAAAAGASLFDLRKVFAGEVPGPQREYAWFPMGIQSYSLREYQPAEKALAEIQKLGLHHVELYGAHLPLDSSPEQIGTMLRRVRRLEIAISAHGVNHFGADHEKNRRVFEFANLAGIRNLSADPDPDSFSSLEKLVEEYGIRIAIHNHGPGHRYGKIEECAKAIEGKHRWIGICADLGHFIRSAEDPVKAIHAFKGRLWGIHLKDFTEQKRDAKGCVLGKGHLDVAGVFRALREVGFPADGALSLEYEESPKNPIAEIQECLAVAREAASRVSGG